ncbi:MAG: hypothetical protein K0S12_2443 [Bacteroidetes bacterium]|jgi:hypothetical protein|nr:hypothetical protein [Bacteroidota bacterium]
MKRFVLITTVFLSLVSFRSFKTKEELWLRGLVENVKSNDLSKFKQMTITEPEFAQIIQNSTWSAEKKESMKKRMTQSFLDQKTKEVYDNVAATVNDNKILWSKTVIDSVTYNKQTFDGIDAMSFKIYLSQDKRKYQLSGDKVLRTQIGWKLSNGLQLSVKPHSK